eukprot:COSAG04_NODE_816_length_10084_cov_4.719179_9_plen_82_part_00
MTNLRDPALAKDGLDYDTLSKELPNLIYCHFTAWGRQGPKRNDPGYDVGGCRGQQLALSLCLSPCALSLVSPALLCSACGR